MVCCYISLIRLEISCRNGSAQLLPQSLEKGSLRDKETTKKEGVSFSSLSGFFRVF